MTKLIKGLIIRTIYNGYEPTNRVKLYLNQVTDDEYEVTGLTGNLHFTDGTSKISINQREDGRFDWLNGDESGITDTWEQATKNMPALITHPDHFEDSDIFIINEEKHHGQKDS